MKWVTRERLTIDRMACPWLIRRFAEAEAEFLYVPTEKVFEVAAAAGALPYNIPGAEPLGPVNELCSFHAFPTHYSLTDPSLRRLGVIVRGADTDRLDLAPAGGLFTISLGLSARSQDDHARLEHAMVVYDALHARCGGHEQETHDRTPGTAVP
jgi:hypothetical protein